MYLSEKSFNLLILQLPIQIDIIKHRSEIDGKSTSAHASILASNHVKVYEYPMIPDYSTEEGVVLIFPSQDSCSIASLFSNNDEYTNHRSAAIEVPKGINLGTLLLHKLNETNPAQISKHSNYNWSNIPVKRAVFIDSTWNQCRGIYKDNKINSLKCVVLQNRLTQFWRHQQGTPRWYLSTIEAVHQFLIELHMHAFGLNAEYLGLDQLELSKEFLSNIKISNDNHLGDGNNLLQPYNGQYDNLLFFFTYMYDLIHSYYDHDKLKSYKRPMN